MPRLSEWAVPALVLHLQVSGKIQENWVFNIVQDGDGLSGTSAKADGSDTVALTGSMTDDTVEIVEQWGSPNFIYAGAIQSDSSMNGSCMYADGTWPGSWVGTKR